MWGWEVGGGEGGVSREVIRINIAVTSKVQKRPSRRMGTRENGLEGVQVWSERGESSVLVDVRHEAYSETPSSSP